MTSTWKKQPRSTCLIVACLTTLAPAVCLAQPSTVAYQGELRKDGIRFHGNADFKFAIVAEGQTLWSNDGTSAKGSEPTDLVSVPVSSGIFSVLLGESPMVPLDANLLNESTDPVLRVWVDTGDGSEQLSDLPISSSVFSLHSESADGAPADFHAQGNLQSGNSIIINGSEWKILTDHPSGDLYIGNSDTLLRCTSRNRDDDARADVGCERRRVLPRWQPVRGLLFVSGPDLRNPLRQPPGSLQQ